MRTSVISGLFLAMAMLIQSVATAGILLPGDPQLSQQFGDFRSYSLPFLNNFFGGGFDVQSSPGQISSGVVIATGAGGNAVNQNFAGMNDAYQTPNPGGASFFETATGNPGSFSTAPVNDSTLHWDANVSALDSFLSTTGQLVFFFNLNEQGSADSLDGLDLLVWAEMSLYDLNNNLARKFIVSAADDPLTAANELALGLAASQAGGPDPDPVLTTDPRWATAHGRITVDSAGNFLHFGSKLGTDPVGAATINQNLGANLAAFAVYNSELDDLIRNHTAAYSRLSIDLRLSKLSGGFEQLFILNDTNVVSVVPEPMSLVIWSGIGIAAFAGRRFRRVQKA